MISATAISLGTAVGGWRIMHTMGHRVVDLEPIHGFAAETTGATVIYGAALLGMPVSTTHVISSSIMGVGSSKGTRGGPLGRRPQHPHRLGAHDPRGDARRRARVVPAQRSASSDRHPRHRRTDRPSPKGTPMVRLIPKDEKFQELFVEDARILLEAARKLEEMIGVYDRLDERVSEIRALEHEGDEIDNEVEARLDRAFITPVRSRGHPRPRVAHRRRARRHPGGRRDVRDLRRQGADRRRPAPGRDPRGAGAAAQRGHRQARVAQGPRAPHPPDPRARERGGRALARRRRPAVPGRDRGDRGHQVARRLHALENTIDAAEDAAEVIERIVAKNA